jgi:hypothetical protein
MMTVGIRDAERESSRRVYCLKSRTRGFVHAVAKKHAVWIYCVALFGHVDVFTFATYATGA